jgi:hypothetical protein
MLWGDKKEKINRGCNDNGQRNGQNVRLFDLQLDGLPEAVENTFLLGM